MVTGTVFDIQRFSIHDGPGIRTTVFLKGCPLTCPWCHNPEGQKSAPELSYLDDKCVRCGACVAACPVEAHCISRNEHTIDHERCTVCGTCVDACVYGALEIVGEEKSVDEVISVVERDEPFYKRSGGGMTLSGGEPLSQPAFSLALLRAAKQRGFHTCIETSGFGSGAAFGEMLGSIDLIYFDIKETDPDRHRDICGVDRATILANLELTHKAGIEIVLRCPVIPAVNDRTDHFRNVAAIAEAFDRISRIHVLPYHRLGTDKQRRLHGIVQPVFETPGDDRVVQWVEAIAAHTSTPVERG